MTSPQVKEFIIGTINPGSTSTKLAIFRNGKLIVAETIEHTSVDTSQNLWDQFEFRLKDIEHFFARSDAKRFDAIVGRGGLLKPVKRGVYKVNETMLTDARNGVQGEHASNMGAELAQKIAKKWNCDAYIVDPVSVDDFEPLARYSGHPLIERRTLSHALNIGAAAQYAAKKYEIDFNQSKFIVAHLGGGISIAAVKGGRIIDVNDAAGGGPFSPERSGSLPLQQFADLCFSGRYSKKQIKKMIMGEGGLYAYLGTPDLKKIENEINNGNENTKQVFEAMIYQIAKEISSLTTVFYGLLDGIVLTGGLVHSKMLVRSLKRRISFLAPITILEGELEMETMAHRVLGAMRGGEKIKVYE